MQSKDIEKGDLFMNVNEKEEKIYKYIEATWYDIHCKDKKEVKEIIRQEVEKYPNCVFSKLYIKCKRRCIAEL